MLDDLMGVLLRKPNLPAAVNTTESNSHKHTPITSWFPARSLDAHERQSADNRHSA